MKRDDFLVEIHTEELPPKALLKLAQALCESVTLGLQNAGLSYENIQFFAAPRRLAVFVTQLAAAQPDQTIERKGPALKAAFDAEGKPSPACIGFARSCGVTPDALLTLKNEQGEWVGLKQQVTGKPVAELLPAIVSQAATTLPIPKRMRWGQGDVQFVRPVHSIILLYGDQVIDATILGCQTGRVTKGHRFLAPGVITIPHAAAYLSLLKTEGYVIADFAECRAIIKQTASALAQQMAGKTATAFISDDLLDEVTGLVEWPVALGGQFSPDFLKLPNEVLISAMQDHQRYFPVIDEKQQLLPYFITISNIDSHEPNRVIHGNERVLRARLSDAAFFYAVDQKENPEQNLARLKGILFQAKLGTLYDKAERLSKIAAFIASHLNLNINQEQATRAGWLAKTDLTTHMVGEFPELQGVMGYYYAKHHGEQEAVAIALKEQYMPRFAGDRLPETLLGQVLALADRIDTLTGTFGIDQAPTGDKDPYGLRRAAVGVIRIIIENKLNLDLKALIEFAISCYNSPLANAATGQQLLNFIQERLRSWYQEQGVSPDVFSAVAALQITNLLDMAERIKAVQAFKKLPVAEVLSIANKRVSNILSKYGETIDAQSINPAFFEHAAEQILAQQLAVKSQLVQRLSQAGKYDEVLVQLAELRQPIDDFFEQVMVMAEDKPRRENRILLLNQLRELFLQVADIALLQ